MTYYKEIYIAFNADMSEAHISQAFLNSALQQNSLEVLSEDCLMICSCNSSSVLLCEDVECDEQASCGASNGLSQCFCNFGYTGDGFTCTGK